MNVYTCIDVYWERSKRKRKKKYFSMSIAKNKNKNIYNALIVNVKSDDDDDDNTFLYTSIPWKIKRKGKFVKRECFALVYLLLEAAITTTTM